MTVASISVRGSGPVVLISVSLLTGIMVGVAGLSWLVVNSIRPVVSLITVRLSMTWNRLCDSVRHMLIAIAVNMIRVTVLTIGCFLCCYWLLVGLVSSWLVSFRCIGIC